MDDRLNTLIRGCVLLCDYDAENTSKIKQPYKVIKMDVGISLSHEPLIQSRKLKAENLNEEILAWTHELNQSLMVMNTYVSGCIHRLGQNRLNNEQVLEIMKKIAGQIELLANKIHRMKS